NDAYDFADSVYDLRPGCASVMRTVDVRPHVIESKRVDSGIGGEWIEASWVDGKNLHPRRHLWRRDIFPGRSAVCGRLDQTIVRSDPDPIDIFVRRANGVDHASLRGLRGWLIRVFADAFR